MRRLLLTALTALSCTKAGPPAPPPVSMVASVNGVPITAAEVEYRLRAGGGHQGEVDVSAAAKHAALEAMVTQEVLAQRALELGLDAAPATRAVFEQLEAQVREVRRRELARAFLEQELASRAQPTPAEVEAWFAENAGRVRTEVRVSQLLFRGREEASGAVAEMGAGRSFDEVAAARVPEAQGTRPWQLGFLAWQQVPDAWWPELERLQPGQVSGIIAGPRERYWIIRLDEKRENPGVTLAQVRPALENVLRAEKLERLRESIGVEQRAKAKVEFIARP